MFLQVRNFIGYLFYRLEKTHKSQKEKKKTNQQSEIYIIFKFLKDVFISRDLNIDKSKRNFLSTYYCKKLKMLI